MSVQTDRKRIRIVLAKPGLDTHDRGVKMIARTCRDAGMEVVYLQSRLTPEETVKIAIEESADIIGLSILSGIHIPFARKLIKALQERQVGEIPVVMGGTIPHTDIKLLKEIGVREVYTPGVPLKEIVQDIERICTSER